MEELFPEFEDFDYSWNIVSESQKVQSVEMGLRAVIASHKDVSLETFTELLEYEETQNRIMFGSMQALSWLVFLFGVINLINTTLSNQMSRKRENSILCSIDLTPKQLCKMNICKGMCYAFSATLVTLTVGGPIAVVVCKEISKVVFAGKIMPYQFPVWDKRMFVLALLGVEVGGSGWGIWRQRG